MRSENNRRNVGYRARSEIKIRILVKERSSLMDTIVIQALLRWLEKRLLICEGFGYMCALALTEVVRDY